MSKISTRKGLAFGALVALGASVIAGTPALAADSVTLAPSAGTAYATLNNYSDVATAANDRSQAFTLATSIDASVAYVGDNTIAFKVINSGAKAIVAKAIQRDAVTNTTDALAAAASKTDVLSTTPATASSATSFYVTPAASVRSKSTFLSLATASFGEDVSVDVIAFVDSNTNGTLDDGEFKSPTRTISFLKPASVTATTAFVAPALNTSAGAKLAAAVTFTPEINTAQLGTAAVKVQFTKNPSTDLGTTSATQDAATTDNKGYYAESNAGAIAAGTYTAQARVFDGAGAAAADWAVSGNQVSTTLSAAAADLLGQPVVTKGANVVANSTTATNADVRTGTTSVEVSSLIKNTVSGVQAAVGAGVAVKVTVARTTLSATSTITAGGKSLTSTSTDSSITFDATTNASGKVVFTLGNSGAKATDAVAVTVKLAGVADSATTAIVWRDAVVSNLVAVDADPNLVQPVAKGGAVSIKFALVDDFGAKVSTSGYRVNAVYTAIGASSAASTPVAVANGEAVVSFTDPSTATGNYNVVATAEKLNAATGAYDTVAGAGNTKTVVVYVTSALVPATATATATITTAAGATAALEAKDFINADRRIDANTVADPAFSATELYTITGTISAADSSVVPGATVTISAKGLQFATGTGASRYATDSITVRATSNGTYSVLAYSHKAGTFDVTVTSGAATKTAEVKFDEAAADSGSAVSVAVAKTAKVGRTLPVVVTLVDKYGNPVDTATADGKLTVTVSGPGYTTTVADHSDAKGQVKFNVILGSGDTGVVSITADYDSNGATANVAGTTVVATATSKVLVGISAKITKASTSKVTVKNALGASVKVVRGTKSVTKTATSDSFNVSLKGGSGTVKVYVEGILVASKK